MYATINIEGKDYSDFNEIYRLNELEEYIIKVSIKQEDGTLFETLDSGTPIYSGRLRFRGLRNSDDDIDIVGTFDTETNGLINFDLQDNLEGKGPILYKVFLNIVNSTTDRTYNIYMGKIIITNDEA